MDYAAARAVLDRLPRFEVKPGLERVDRLLAALGRPERSFPAVHVTGTNGKGSVVAMLASVLGRAGYRVGRYTSPDVVDFRDRICIDGEWIGESAMADLVTEMERELFAHDDVPSQFEALTALAFEHFRRSAVDVAVVEVGMGGRFDATNVVTPILTMLTNVTLDHTAHLGSTVGEIAWEKAGIAKPTVPMIVGELAPEAARVVARECRAVGAPLRTAGVPVEAAGRDGRAQLFALGGQDLPDRVSLPLLGLYQRENLALAISALLALRDRGWHVPEDAVRDGLASAAWPGRWEIAQEEPTVILDGAHNPAGAAAAIATIVEWEPRRERRALLLGILADKDVHAIVSTLAPHFARIGVAASSSPRSLSTAALAGDLERAGVQPIRYDSVKEGVWGLVGLADPADTILVTGSLTVVAEAREALLPLPPGATA